MMIIDFHTHLFPPAIAERAISGIVDRTLEIYGMVQPVAFNGTIDGLKESMKKTGVDISVVQPIATKVTQYATINRYAKEITCENVISFASLHPYQENVREVLDDICREGFKGIKLHPDYQGVEADDEKFIALVKRATELGLYVTIHSGEDLGMRAPYKCMPDRLERLLDKVDQQRIILAHMGGFNVWDELIERGIVGCGAYFDTSVVSRYIDIEKYRKIIDMHGADKILFGSDTPWEDPALTYKFLCSAGLSAEEMSLICEKNAAGILGL